MGNSEFERSNVFRVGKELSLQYLKGEKWVEELIMANRELSFQTEDNEKLTVDLTRAHNELKKAEEKISKVNRLYAFLSHSNRNIIEVKNEKELFDNSCRIALEFGKFKMAWIGLFDIPKKKISLVAHCGIAVNDVLLFRDTSYQKNGPQDYVLKTGISYICNNIEDNIELEDWKPFADKHSICSCMVLPIKRSEEIIGTFNLYSEELDFSNKEEIELLLEVTNDISFSLDVFEKTKLQKRTEQLLKEAERNEKKTDELILANKELEQFVYIASHDLQEPLRTVANYIKVFEEDYSNLLDENTSRYLRSIKNASNRMSLLIKSLLDLAKLGHNTKLTTVDCEKLLYEVIADLDDIIKNSKAFITVGEMPTLNLYETEIRQVFQNLITNAVKFRKKNISPQIDIRSEKINDQWKFYVSDNGIGIEEVHFERIFDVFQRLHSNEKYEGNGIGLANCKKIIQLHKGKIGLESIVGKGTIFHFTISQLSL